MATGSFRGPRFHLRPQIMRCLSLYNAFYKGQFDRFHKPYPLRSITEQELDDYEIRRGTSGT